MTDTLAIYSVYSQLAPGLSQEQLNKLFDAFGSTKDTLIGGSGNDVYVFGRNYGMDTLIENDFAPGNVDTVRFLPDISADQIWFERAGNNLEVSVIGTTDKVVINDWYLGSANHIERFKTSDGLTLRDRQVDDLVNAMADFALPDLGETILPPDYASILSSTITSHWG